MRRAVRYLTLLPLILAFGCSAPARRSTPTSRIHKNRKLFHTYPPSVQKAIWSGQIQHGFDQNKVYLALGKATRKAATGASETWLYAKRVRKKIAAPSSDETRYLKRTRVVRVVRFKNGRVSSWEDPPGQYLDEWHE
jgi:hypothetical protein